MKRITNIFLVAAAAVCLNLIPADSQAMKIKVRGAGGLVRSGDDVDICPLKSRELCAIIECSLKDCIIAWFENLLQPVDGGGGSGDGDGGSTVIVMEAGLPVSYHHVRITALPDDFLIRGAQEGIEGSEIGLMQMNEVPGF